MVIVRTTILIGFLIATTATLRAQTTVDSTEDDDFDDDSTALFVSPFETTVAIGIGFSVGAVSAQDIIALINQELGEGTISRHGFGGAAGYTSALTWRPFDFYDISLSQAHLTRAWQFGDNYAGITSYGYDINTIALVVHRVYLDDEYSVTWGVGGGVLFGSYRSSYQSGLPAYVGSVRGGMVGGEAIFRSPFGGHFFLHTEIRVSLTFSGALHDAFGNERILLETSQGATLRSLSGSVNVGLDYCF